MITLTATSLRIVSKRDDGSGVIEIPVAVPAMIDLARTASKRKGTFDFSLAVMKEIAANFTARPGPKPVYYDHISDDARKTTPAAGFVEAAWIEAGALWNRVDLNAQAFNAIVNQRGFRAASVEIDADKEHPTGTIAGWSQGALAITNTPATDVQFRVAASEGDQGSDVIVTTGMTEPSALGRKGDGMGEVTLTALQSENALLRASDEGNKNKVTALTADLDNARVALTTATTERDDSRVKAARLTVELEEKTTRNKALDGQVAKLTAERDAAEQKAATLESAQIGARVRRIILSAVRSGVDAAMFEGSDENEVAWLNARFASCDAFEKFIGQIPKRKGAVSLSTDTKEAKLAALAADDESDVIPADQAAALRKRGLNPKFAIVKDSNHLAQIRASEKGD